MYIRLGFLILIIFVTFSAGVGGSVLGVDNGGGIVSQQDHIDADEVRIDVALSGDGSATWTLAYWIALDDNESRSAFASISSDIDSDPDAFTGSFHERLDETIRTAENATGREMTAENVTVGAERQTLTGEYGVIRYGFEWDGFAESSDGELRVGDAIEGLYLDEGSRLVIRWSSEYDLNFVRPTPDEERGNSVIWAGGETEFVTDEPQVVLQVEDGLGVGTIAGIGTGLAVLTAIIGWWIHSRSDTDQHSSPTGEHDTMPNPPPDESLLSNEEQVIQLLEMEGGRIKQQRVVEQLGWTDAKTSKVINELRETGAIESFRLGRENVLRIPDEDSPHDER